LYFRGKVCHESEANLRYTSVKISRTGFEVLSIHKHSETGDAVYSEKVYWHEIEGLADALREAAKRPLDLMPEFAARVESGRSDLRTVTLEDESGDAPGETFGPSPA